MSISSLWEPDAMPYTIPSFPAIRQRMLRDAANLDPTAPQDRDSDHFARSSATASAVSGLYDFLAWQARQLLPDTADPEYLEQHCALRGKKGGISPALLFAFLLPIRAQIAANSAASLFTRVRD